MTSHQPPPGATMCRSPRVRAEFSVLNIAERVSIFGVSDIRCRSRTSPCRWKLGLHRDDLRRDLADAFVPLAVVNVLPAVKSCSREALKLDRVFRQPVSFHKLYLWRETPVVCTAFCRCGFTLLSFCRRSAASFVSAHGMRKSIPPRGLFESVRRFPTQAASAGYNFQSSARSRSAASACRLFSE